jgi:hypothetical protein
MRRADGAARRGGPARRRVAERAGRPPGGPLRTVPSGDQWPRPASPCPRGPLILPPIPLPGETTGKPGGIAALSRTTACPGGTTGASHAPPRRLVRTHRGSPRALGASRRRPTGEGPLRSYSDRGAPDPKGGRPQHRFDAAAPPRSPVRSPVPLVGGACLLVTTRGPGASARERARFVRERQHRWGGRADSGHTCGGRFVPSAVGPTAAEGPCRRAKGLSLSGGVRDEIASPNLNITCIGRNDG